ncbi:hypothetical protein [Stigmatella aurantiaca]|uniref:Latency associated antigen n=1 Tax=Stigmatella aurantiaca (strain DW4/3-1) TaxID=378806 RepID=Q08Y11_STIAD|nr:hypothetical protein [Stigmatella aurantiaca]ADO69968.1 Latency associated antigen [Stigmatella aurantiaca DW4/3-1]EAU65362.1 latency associated antigen [Stigmatella aurantiaca DW4/3-1]
MARHGWKAWTVVGLLGTAGLVTGCSEQETRENARQVGQEVGNAARNVKEATREAAEGFQEGVGGSGVDPQNDGHIGDRKGGIDDGEGPFEQPARPGEDKTILNDGEGPLDGTKNR